MLGNGSPRSVYTFFLLGLNKEFFSLVLKKETTEADYEDGCTCLVSYCPDEAMQDKLWDFYVETKKKSGSSKYAAIRTVGKLTAYLTGVLELTETSTGGIL